MIKGTEIYDRVMASPQGDELMHKVWDNTPWIIDCYTGGIDIYGRYQEIREWCTENFGKEAWPIHDKPGNWNVGSATIHGWTWIGFHTVDMMHKFLKHWPNPTIIKGE